MLPTPFRIAACGAAAIAASAVAAGRLWELRGRPGQSIEVDARRAAAGLRSAKYLMLDGAPPAPPWDSLSGFYPVAGGRWISVHCNFPVHRDAAVRTLGVAPDADAIRSASAAWDGEALETAIHAAGGCAGFVRTAEEWQRHPQAKAVSDQTLLEIERIGDAPPRPLPASDRPMGGIRALDLTRVLAGPTCARVLAEHGADVLKINAPHLPDSGAVELDTGVGKRAAFLDLRTEAGTTRLRDLALTADVFSQSYRPGALARRGFSPKRLAQDNPGIVCVSLSAWGPTGPWRDRRGFDTIVQSVSGMVAQRASGQTEAHGATGGIPGYLPVSAIDYVSGYLMAFGAMAALARRAETGGSWLVRVALARVGKWIVDQGLVDGTTAPKEFPPAEIAAWTMEWQSPAGRIRHLSPIAQMSDTPARWTQPPVRPGTCPPEWW